jgi:hypothetical protein
MSARTPEKTRDGGRGSMPVGESPSSYLDSIVQPGGGSCERDRTRQTFDAHRVRAARATGYSATASIS